MASAVATAGDDVHLSVDTTHEDAQQPPQPTDPATAARQRKAVTDAVGKYKPGTPILTFIQILKLHIAANGISLDDYTSIKLIALGTAESGSNAQQQILAMTDLCNTADELFQRMIMRFGDQTTPQLRVQKILQTAQGRRSMDNYVQHFQEQIYNLQSPVKLEYEIHWLTAIFIAGVESESTRQQLNTQPFDDLQALFAQALAADQSGRRRWQQPQPRAAPNPNGRKPNGNPDKRTDKPPEPPIEKVKCFNCNKLGHYATSCPQPKRQRNVAATSTDAAENDQQPLM